MSPEWKSDVIYMTPPAFRRMVRHNIDALAAEFEIFLKMGFTGQELCIEVDENDNPPSWHVIVNTMKH